MLTQLTVANFAIVKFLELDFAPGMTTITGETGAGKSIAIDALSLCLGGRGEAAMVRPGAERAEISARFDVSQIPAAIDWLRSNALDEEEECILRRSIGAEGRSRAWINGNPVPLSQLKALGENLISIHGQHAHHGMLHSDTQLTLLDQYAGHHRLLQGCQDAYQQWRSIDLQLKQLREQQAQRVARAQLLEYQVQELDEFALQPGEFEAIEVEHRRLANCGTLLEQSQRALYLLSDGDEVNVQSLLQQAISQVEALAEEDPALGDITNMLHEGLIQVQESSSELERYRDRLEMDPERFTELENRLSRAMSLARKHMVPANELAEHHQNLAEELADLASSDEQIEQLEQSREAAHAQLAEHALKLNKSRQRYARELDKLVTENLKALAMPHARFQINVEHRADAISPSGGDRVQFLVTTNPGQPLQPIAKSASGGELSRIGLAIQVITAKKVATPTLIFDEVDVGISGPTAAVVGRMLRQLGQSTQVFCVTHLPQVAGNGHNHMFVAKQSQGKSTETRMTALLGEARLQELARLLGGDTITDNTLANARELLVLDTD
ncbi:DNA repair protein RecN [Ferrimonas balearica]|uniref:DNA repair protein RecN n=1 Tax=Ferrimonas balearica TaxID=44012 RepID=UPI001C99C474|nr:DNA repair protein RecN [Ferrimonas balearica]MBY5921841.1 DNA repair protein RecN [Ferrimonas balearica]MBY5994819.1 DNA repair protein RecN [Ferrimonas balearica]